MTLRRRTVCSDTADKQDDKKTEVQHTSKEAKEETIARNESTMNKYCGFDWDDFETWEKFVRLLHRPRDPTSLAVLRILFGVLMMSDILQERGLAFADYIWGDPEECHFPLFDFVQPLPLRWMYIVYLTMLIGAAGITLGMYYRQACGLFVLSYWYIVLLDKTTWNNHSYLFGLCGILLFFTDAHRAWSVDGLVNKDMRHSHVPLWNYTLFRTQFFLVYFLAGLKKLDADWVHGYSMQRLSHHWIFTPFQFFMTKSQVDLVVVHHGGLLIDLFVGYGLFFDKTRYLAMFFSSSFHLMNSQIFSIGMFPWTMLATSPIFCYAQWPKTLVKKVFRIELADAQNSNHCIYPPQPEPSEDKDEAAEENDVGVSDEEKNCKEDEDPSCQSGDLSTKQEAVNQNGTEQVSQSVEGSNEVPKVNGSVSKQDKTDRVRRTEPGRRSHMAATFCVMYLLIQLFLPYSHFITKGYNNWTNGLYGYSWDMMVHSWSTQHIRITYVDQDTGKTGYLNPEAWSHSRKRWAAHADMVKQYAACIKDRLTQFNITNVELYFDVWRSLNDRFQQRTFDPRVNILTADWSPFKETSWVLPLLTDLSDWRGKLDDIEKGVYDKDNVTDVVFIADFPGLSLENYIQEELNDTSLHVLNGIVQIEFPHNDTVVELSPGDVIQVPAGEFHNVLTLSEVPSCLMYLYRNTTEELFSKNMTLYELQMRSNSSNETQPDDSDQDHVTERVVGMYKHVTDIRGRMEMIANATMKEKFGSFLYRKSMIFKRGLTMMRIALVSIITQQPFETVFNNTLGHDILEDGDDV